MANRLVDTPGTELGLAAQCTLCGTALSGPVSLLFRVTGITRSSRNPNLCSRCNTHAVEGRVVELTALFADLSAFTELTQELGPERTHEVVDAYLRMATGVLAKYDAFVDKFIGDAVLAFFNLPLRQTDHAARAVRAALEIQSGLAALRERFGLELAARVGIASGWARVGRLGSADGKDYTAVGDVVNLASRLEGQARSGELLIDGAAYRNVSESFPNLAAEWLSLKGFREPVQAYRLNAAPDLGQQAPTPEPAGIRPIHWGSVLFAILGAPCAAAVLIGPLAVTLGIGSAVGATSALWALGEAPIRVPVQVLAILGALANLYTVWHARQLRRRALAEGSPQPMTSLERRRTLLVVGSAVAILALVAFDSYARANILIMSK